MKRELNFEVWFQFCCLNHLNLITGNGIKQKTFCQVYPFLQHPLPVNVRYMFQWELRCSAWAVTFAFREVAAAYGNNECPGELEEKISSDSSKCSLWALHQCLQICCLSLPQLGDSIHWCWLRVSSHTLWPMRAGAKSAGDGLSVTSVTHMVQGETKALMFHRFQRISRVRSLPLSKALKCKLNLENIYA